MRCSPSRGTNPPPSPHAPRSRPFAAAALLVAMFGLVTAHQPPTTYAQAPDQIPDHAPAQAPNHDKPTTVAVLGVDLHGVDLHGVDLHGVSGFPAGTDQLLADLLSIELSRFDTVHVVDRDQLDDVFDEHARRLSGRLDRPRRPGPAHRHALTGAAFLVHGRAWSYQDQLTVSIRVTETATGLARVVIHEGSVHDRLAQIAPQLALQIRDALHEQIQHPPAPATTAAPAQPPSGLPADRHPPRRIDAQTPLPRVCILIDVTNPADPLHLLEVGRALSSMLSMRGFGVEVDVLVDDDPASGDPLPPPPPADPADPIRRPDDLPRFDMIVIARASAQTGLRTAALITAQARVTLTLYDAPTSQPLATLEATRPGLAAAAPAATRQALRRAARAVLEPLLAELLEAKP